MMSKSFILCSILVLAPIFISAAAADAATTNAAESTKTSDATPPIDGSPSKKAIPPQEQKAAKPQEETTTSEEEMKNTFWSIGKLIAKTIIESELFKDVKKVVLMTAEAAMTTFSRVINYHALTLGPKLKTYLAKFGALSPEAEALMKKYEKGELTEDQLLTKLSELENQGELEKKIPEEVLEDSEVNKEVVDVAASLAGKIPEDAPPEKRQKAIAELVKNDEAIGKEFKEAVIKTASKVMNNESEETETGSADKSAKLETKQISEKKAPEETAVASDNAEKTQKSDTSADEKTNLRTSASA